MHDNSISRLLSGSSLSRRDFLSSSMIAAASLAILGTPGCSSYTRKNAPEIDYKSSLKLIHCNLIDVNSGNIQADATLTLEKGIIRGISAGSEDGPHDQKTTTIDMKGMYVIPGLIDAHCHITMTGVMAFSSFEVPANLRQMKKNYSNTVEAGITTVRDVGSLPKELHSYMEKIASGSMIGPRILFCNSIMNISGGHPGDINPSDISIFAKPMMLFTGSITADFKDDKDLSSKLAENAEGGASFIKLTIDNISVICGMGKIPVYEEKHLKTIFDFAEKKNLPVICHNHFKFGWNRMMKYPFFSQEHILSDTLLTDREIEAMVRKKIANVPTCVVGMYLSPAEALGHMPDDCKTDFIMNELKIKKDYLLNHAKRYIEPSLHESNMKNQNFYREPDCNKHLKNKIFLARPETYFNVMKNGFENLRKKREAGLLIGCGTDAGTPLNYFGALWMEMELYSRLGFSHIEVLRCATINNARICNLQDKIGSLEKGKFADIVALSKNPLVDITAYRDPEMVFKQGEMMFSRKKIDRKGDMLIPSDLP